MTQLILQLPAPVIDSARRLAEQQNVSVEELVSRVVADTVSQDEAWNDRARRERQVSRERFLAILRKAPDVPPMPGDEIEP